MASVGVWDPRNPSTVLVTPRVAAVRAMPRPAQIRKKDGKLSNAELLRFWLGMDANSEGARTKVATKTTACETNPCETTSIAASPPCLTNEVAPRAVAALSLLLLATHDKCV